MPTITLQVGQCGNQLGSTLWDLMQHQQSHCNSSNSIVSREWFSSSSCCQQISWDQTDMSDSQQVEQRPQPRCICVDSEAKVVKKWEGDAQGPSQRAVHMLGKGGGCGNNWSCGYSLAFSTSTGNHQCAWSVSDDTCCCIDQVLHGIRQEAEKEAGVPDFLLLSSLAGGTGSGFGSALLEVLADEFACSTVAAAAVAPGRGGGSDTATQSINCCLALQHLSQHAHAVLLLDNQVMLDQLNSQLSSSSRGGTSSRGASGSTRSSSSSRAQLGVGGGPAAVSGRACLQGVNELAAQALLGLLWPVGGADQLAGRSNIRQLVSTIAADPLTKFLEVCHVSQPDADIPINMMNNPWPPRLKLLASQLPSYDPFYPTQPVTASAAVVIARGGLCRQPTKAVGSSTNSRDTSVGLNSSSSSSCWVSAGGLGCAGLPGGSSGSSGGGWGVDAALCAVGSTWPRWSGSSWDVHMADSPALLWSADLGKCASSLTAAVRCSSTGSFLRDVSAKCMQLCDAGAYMHWYQQYGTAPAEIKAAAGVLAELAAGY